MKKRCGPSSYVNRQTVLGDLLATHSLSIINTNRALRLLA
jgi:hypothetical protein